MKTNFEKYIIKFSCNFTISFCSSAFSLCKKQYLTELLIQLRQPQTAQPVSGGAQVRIQLFPEPSPEPFLFRAALSSRKAALGHAAAKVGLPGCRELSIAGRQPAHWGGLGKPGHAQEQLFPDAHEEEPDLPEGLRSDHEQTRPPIRRAEWAPAWMAHPGTRHPSRPGGHGRPTLSGAAAER